MITVLVCYERISLFHTMEPFFRYRSKGGFRFTQSADFCLAGDTNKTLFMERCFQYRAPRDLKPEELEMMKKLRDRYKNIVFFCGQPEAGTNRLDLLPYVDRLFYKSVFSDRNNYLKKLYGKNLFADHYHFRYGICDHPEYITKETISSGSQERPELSWNIGVGSYPRSDWPQRAGVVLARAGLPSLGRLAGGVKFRRSVPRDFSGLRRGIAVHARIDPVSCPSIAHQRRLFLDIISRFGEKDRALFLTGMTSQRRYYRELTDAKIVLSPFGWGEVCFRDFEAILSGALLFKPDMSHLKTWPDVYIPYETYIPLDWDGQDLLEKTKQYMEDDKERKRIAENAYHRYRSELSGLGDRFYSLLGDLL
ncbi:MAG: glycosyltransferase [Treponema sp.]|jgi:hypothetical protein|nr:glycosyltransferase [Treponema sp.]